MSTRHAASATAAGVVSAASWLLPALADRQSISDLAGTTSFTVWLFAQTPQILENYRRGSVDGLSPVFVAQWMLGDATNLIGCILTGQLPFQIAVATYFCCIDLCIAFQYVYYTGKAKADMRRASSVSARPVRSRMSSLIGYQPPVQPFATAPTETSELLPGSSRRHHTRSSRSRPRLTRRESDDMEDSFYSHTATYRALRDAAMSVAQLADEAARRRQAARDPSTHRPHHHHHHQHSQSQQSHHHSRRTTGAKSMSRSTSRQSSVAAGRSRTRGPQCTQGADWTPSTLSPTASDSEDGEVPLAMLQSTASLPCTASRSLSRGEPISYPTTPDPMQSLGSLGDRRGRDMTRKAIRPGLLCDSDGSASPTPSDSTTKDPGRPAGLQQPRSDQTAPANASERLAPRSDADADASEDEGDEDGDAAATTTTTPRQRADRSGSRPSKSRARSSHSIRRGFGMALMGLVLVLAVAEGPAQAMTRPTSVGMLGPATQQGIANAARQVARVVLNKLRHPASVYLSAIGVAPSLSPSLQLEQQGSMVGGGSGGIVGLLDDMPLPPATGSPSWDRLLGRLSAWSCTILYMTSRLPQIWKNHTRRSVEGLSILLFVAAFLGNLTYSISILASPEAVGEARREYLQECIPFLLGSGGTLVFDFVIVVQWMAWRGGEGE
ncbi:hypothetical protein ACQY0O_004508 [Thecaphora frezii]